MTRVGARRAVFVASSVLALFSASCRGCGRPSDRQHRDFDAAALANPPSIFGDPAIDVEPYRVRAHVPAIAWAVVTRENGWRSSATGLANIEQRQHATSTQPFEAASIAKTIIATCVMQLVEAGRMSLDEDVSTYVSFPVRPRARANEKSTRDKTTPVTLRHLLTHTSSIVDLPSASAASTTSKAAENGSGLGDFIEDYFAADAGRASSKRADVFLDSGVGTTMVYSNVGPSLAALAVERLVHTSFAERARASVFEPLGMRATRFGIGAAARGDASSEAVATNYASVPVATPRDSGFVPVPHTPHVLYPVVDLFTSASDLALFAAAILNGGVGQDGDRILSKASVDLMLRVAQVDAAPDDALGWQARTFGGMRVVGHEGEDRGASTGLYIDPEAGVGAVVLANGDAFQSDDPDRAKAISELITKLLESGREMQKSSRGSRGDPSR